MKYNIFLVDADDTVFDFQKAFRVALKNAFIECGLSYQEEYGDVYKRVNDGLWRRLERKEITKEQLIRLRFSAILREIGVDYDDMRLNDAYVKNLGDCALFLPGADEFLKSLKQMGDVYIVTNGFAKVQKRRMEKFNMAQYAKGYFISEEIGAEKPDIRFMDYVFSHIENFDRDRAIVIGDGLTSDIRAAENAGIDSVWFNQKGKPLPEGFCPTFVAGSYEDVLSFLKRA